MRNLEYPLDWDAVFAYVGEHGFMKPVDGGGWRDVYHIHNREEFFDAYDQSRDLCMMYQKAVDFNEYFRCYVVGTTKVHIMPYDPRRRTPSAMSRTHPPTIRSCSSASSRMRSSSAARSATTSTPSSSPSKTASPTPSTS